MQIFALIKDSTEEMDKFYGEITDVKRQCKEEVILVIRDFSAKVGEGSFEDIVRQDGLGNRNERGTR